MALKNIMTVCLVVTLLVNVIFVSTVVIIIRSNDPSDIGYLLKYMKANTINETLTLNSSQSNLPTNVTYKQDMAPLQPMISIEENNKKHQSIIIFSVYFMVWMVNAWPEPVPNCSVECYFDRNAKNCGDPELLKADALVWQSDDFCAAQNFDHVAVHALFHSESLTHPMHSNRLQDAYNHMGTRFNLMLSYKGEDDKFVQKLREQGRQFDVFQLSYTGWEPDMFRLPPLVPVKDRVRSPAVVFISNCQAERILFLKELSQYIDIVEYGRCFPSTEVLPQCANMEVQSWEYRRCITKHFKFYIAIENSEDESYVTEKLYRCFLEGIVPVYSGAPNIEKFLPTYGTDMKSAVLIKDFADVKELGSYLRMLHENNEEYEKYLLWKNYPLPDRFQKLVDNALDRSAAVCNLCKKVLSVKQMKNAQ